MSPSVSLAAIGAPRLRAVTYIGARRGATLSLIALSVQFLSGCGSQRNAASYCDYFYGQGQVVRQRYEDINRRGQPVEQIVALLGAQGDIGSFLDGLAKRSPDEIQADVEALAKAMHKQQDSLSGSVSNPLGGLIGSLLAGAATAGPSARINSYTTKHCGPPPG